MTRKVLGYQYTVTACRACAREREMHDYVPPMLEGDDSGIPYHCDYCDAQLLPCDHQWGEWGPAFKGGEIAFCQQPDCGEATYR